MNALIKVFHQVESNFFSMISTNTVSYSDMVAFSTGVPVSNLNPVILNKITDSFQKNINECKRLYARYTLPWVRVIPGYLLNQFTTDILKNNGFNLNDEGVAMRLALDNRQPFLL